MLQLDAVRLLKKILLIAVLAAAAWLIGQPVLRMAGAFLVVDEPPKRADAIVVLSGSVPDRILEAVDLYEEGYAPIIVLCREPENAGFRELAERGVKLPRIYELNVSVARQLGVPESAIVVLEREAGSTYSEARVVLQELAERGARSMLLVTSQYHTRRAGAIYRHLAGGELEVITRPARSGGFDPDRWWHDRMTIRRVLIEYQKLVLFHLWDRWKISSLSRNRRESENEDSGAFWTRSPYARTGLRWTNWARRETGIKVGTFVEDFATGELARRPPERAARTGAISEWPWRLETVCSPRPVSRRAAGPQLGESSSESRT